MRIAAVTREVGTARYYLLLADGRIEEAYLDYQDFRRGARTFERRCLSARPILNSCTGTGGAPSSS